MSDQVEVAWLEEEGEHLYSELVAVVRCRYPIKFQKVFLYYMSGSYNVVSLYRGAVHLLREAVTRRKTAVQLDPGLIVETREDVLTNDVEREFVKHRRTLLDEAEGWIEGSCVEHCGVNAVGVKKMWPLPPFNFYLCSSASRRSSIFFRVLKMGSRALSESVW